jgi:hypothetical protein
LDLWLSTRPSEVRQGMLSTWFSSWFAPSKSATQVRSTHWPRVYWRSHWVLRLG